MQHSGVDFCGDSRRVENNMDSPTSDFESSQSTVTNCLFGSNRVSDCIVKERERTRRSGHQFRCKRFFVRKHRVSFLLPFV
jgi:hypothetical protein